MRRAAAALLALALLLGTAGCSTLFDKETYELEDYEAPAEPAETEDDAADAISSYAGLRRAITRLVTEHAESAELQFQNYDGTISQDISTACWEVKSSTALGAFVVDYISYDLSRIVSYYQAEINITYKRSAWQVSALEAVENMAGLRARLEEAVRAGETYLVLSLTAASLTADVVTETVERTYYADPLACPVLPAADTAVYPESGVNRIVEVTLDYGLDSESLAARREELAAAVTELAAAADPPAADEASPSDGATEEPSAPSDPARVLALCEYLAEHTTVDETAGDSAWDALTIGTASSEGVAMALAAGCRALGLECWVVAGRLDGEPHAWNIVTLGEGSYHVDAAAWNDGEDRVFLAGDEALRGAYWWDTSEYPACPESYGASEEPSGELFSREPEAGEGEDAAEAAGPGEN